MSTTAFVFYANTTISIALSPIKSYRIVCLDHDTFSPVVGAAVKLGGIADAKETDESGVTIWGQYDSADILDGASVEISVSDASGSYQSL